MPLGWLDHFELLRFIGRGGMSDVYLAHDAHLDCDVALKVLREDHAGDVARRTRLLGEARALAKLDHPNIVGILDCGETTPRPPDFLWRDQPGPHPTRVVYLAMRYVEGRDLTEAIGARQQPLDRVVDWAKQIARGLEAAHARGVVHRDLKPANIRVTPDDVLKIVDFGLASSPRSVVDSMTQTAPMTREVILGTIGYSAPEQGAEAGHVDPRCDLFSLGAILYELVAGRRPFQGNTPIEVLREIATHEPPPMRRFARGVPDELERITRKLLQKNPNRRYQSAHEVLTDLESLPPVVPPDWSRQRRRAVTLGFALLALVVGAYGAFRSCRRPGPETIAVVEFENLTGDPGMERLVNGLRLDMVTSLVQRCRVNVVVSTLRDSVGRPERDPAKVARQYGASTVLLGTLVTEAEPGSAQSLSLHLRTVRARDNSTGWAQRLDAPAKDISSLVLPVSRAVVAHWPQIRAAEASPIAPMQPRPGEAEEAYLRGIALLADSDPVARDSSIAEFDRALALEAGFGRALSGRARAQLAAYLRDRDTTRLKRAERDARQALRLAPSEIEGRLALARILYQRGHTTESIDELRTVLSLNDHNAEAYTQLGNAYRKMGDMDGARQYLQRAVEVTPTSPKAWRAYGIFLLYGVSDFAGAEQAFRQEIRLIPDENRGYEDLGAALLEECRYSDAIATYAKLPKPDANSLDLNGNRGAAYFFSGDYPLALRDFLVSVAAAPEEGLWRLNLGDCYAHMGRGDDALHEYRLAQRFFERDLVADPGDLGRRARYAMSLVRAGDPARARDQVDRCTAANPWRDADVVYYLAKTLALCGDRERALGALDTLVNRRKFSRCRLGVEDEFASLRGDRKFRALVGGAKP